VSQKVRTKRNTQDTQHTTATWTRRHARQRQLQQLERQRRAYSGASRTASSKHGNSRPERPRIGPRSTAKHGRRRHFGRYDHATWNSASLSRPSHATSSNSVERCRWRRHVGSASRRPPNNGTQQTARSSHGRPSRAQIVSTACSQ